MVLFGPLYHLTDRADRLLALRQAYRVLRPVGVVLAAAISRFASALDGLCRGFLKDPQFADIVRRDMTDGQHRNPTGRPEYFMDTFFHHPDELRDEIVEAAFSSATVYAVEGPCWLLPEFDSWWNNSEYRDRLLQIARALETEPSVLGVSAHLVATATRWRASGFALPVPSAPALSRECSRAWFSCTLDPRNPQRVAALGSELPMAIGQKA